MPRSLSTAHRPARLAGPGLKLAAAMVLSASFAVQAVAQTTNPPAAPALPTVPAAPAAPAAPDSAGQPMSKAALEAAIGHDKAARVETHILKLHGDLKITAAQDSDWQALAGAMRQNAVQMDGAYMKRQPAAVASMNAVQNLESYAAFEQTSAESIAPLIPPFRALYESMSPSQKQSADTIARGLIGKAVKKAG